MTTPAEIYHRVVAARPELEAKCPLLRDPSKAHALRFMCGGWWAGDDAGVPEPIAHALIVDHWTEMLPDGCFLCPCDGIHTDNRVWYVDRFHNAPHPLPKYKATRLEALAEHFAPGSTKEQTHA